MTIHHEVTFKAAPNAIFDAIVSSAKFSELSGQPATGVAKEGERFTLFAGSVVGRHLELIPGSLIVQAWRIAAWPEGIYSIARFRLMPSALGTTLVFDHEAFPAGEMDHLDAGWRQHYWDNLAAIEPS